MVDENKQDTGGGDGPPLVPPPSPSPSPPCPGVGKDDVVDDDDDGDRKPAANDEQEGSAKEEEEEEEEDDNGDDENDDHDENNDQNKQNTKQDSQKPSITKRKSKGGNKSCCCNWPDCKTIQWYLRIISDDRGQDDFRLGYNSIFVSRKDMINHTKFSVQKQLLLLSMVRHIGLDPKRLPVFDFSQSLAQSSNNSNNGKTTHGNGAVAAAVTAGDDNHGDDNNKNTELSVSSPATKLVTPRSGGRHFSVARHHYHPLLLQKDRIHWAQPIDAELAQCCGIGDEDKIPESMTMATTTTTAAADKDKYVKAPNMSRQQVLNDVRSHPKVAAYIQETNQAFWQHKTLLPPNKMRSMAFFPRCGIVLLPEAPPYHGKKKSVSLAQYNTINIDTAAKPLPTPTRPKPMEHNTPTAGAVPVDQQQTEHKTLAQKLVGFPKRGGKGLWIAYRSNNTNFDVSVYAPCGILFTLDAKLKQFWQQQQQQQQGNSSNTLAEATWLELIRQHKNKKAEQQQRFCPCEGLQSDLVCNFANRGHDEFAFCALRWSRFRNAWRSQECTLQADERCVSPSHYVNVVNVNDNKPRCQACWRAVADISIDKYPELFPKKRGRSAAGDDDDDLLAPPAKRIRAMSQSPLPSNHGTTTKRTSPYATANQNLTRSAKMTMVDKTLPLVSFRTNKVDVNPGELYAVDIPGPHAQDLGITIGTDGGKIVFLGYRKANDGGMGYAEIHSLFKGKRDIIHKINGDFIEGKSWKQAGPVFDKIKKTRSPVRFTMRRGTGRFLDHLSSSAEGDNDDHGSPKERHVLTPLSPSLSSPNTRRQKKLGSAAALHANTGIRPKPHPSSTSAQRQGDKILSEKRTWSSIPLRSHAGPKAKHGKEGKFPIGARFRKAFDGIQYEGEIVSFDGTYYFVRYNDGDEEELDEEELSLLSPCLGRTGKLGVRDKNVPTEQASSNGTPQTRDDYGVAVISENKVDESQSKSCSNENQFSISSLLDNNPAGDENGTDKQSHLGGSAAAAADVNETYKTSPWSLDNHHHSARNKEDEAVQAYGATDDNEFDTRNKDETTMQMDGTTQEEEKEALGEAHANNFEI